LRLLPAAEHSDPNGLTFHLSLPPGSGTDDLRAEEVEAYWLPPEEANRTEDGGAPEAAAIAGFRAGHYLLPAPKGYYLHIRRVPGEPVRPDSRLLIRFTRRGLPKLDLSPDLPETYRQRQLDVMLLIDESLSMKRNDRQRLRVAAAKAFIDLAKGGGRISRIGIVAFNHESRLLRPLTPLAERDKLFEAANEIRHSGETDLDAAIGLACQELAKATDTDKVAVLLTDGKDQPGVYENSHARFVEKKWPLHAIGLSEKADHGTLRRIANETGGQYHDAPTSGELQRVFGSICFALQRRSLIRRELVSVAPAAPQTLTFDLDRSISNVTFTADAEGTLSHELQLPAGVQPQDYTHGGKSGFRYFDVWSPAPGKWSLVSRAAAESGPGKAEVEATAITTLNLWHFPVEQTYEWGEPIRLAAGLALGNESVAGAAVSASVEYPDGSARQFSYPWRSPVYESVFAEAGQTGKYTLRVRAVGRTPAGEPFEREVRARLEVVETRAPRLWASARSFDFGELYPGETGKKRFDLKLITARISHGVPVTVSLENMTTDGGDRLPATGVSLSPSPVKVSSRALSVFSLGVDVAPDQAPGIYHGSIVLRHSLSGPSGKTASAPIELHTRVRVMEPALIVEPEELNLGSFEAGQTVKPELKIRLAPRGVLPATLTLERHSRDPERFRREIKLPDGEEPDAAVSFRPPGNAVLSSTPTAISLPLKVGRHAGPGARRWTLALTAGRFKQEIPVRFTVTWPELEIPTEALDFGRIFCGQTVDRTARIRHRSVLKETARLSHLDQQATANAHLSGPESIGLAPSAALEKGNTPLTLELSPPLDAKPGQYAGTVRLRTWFGRWDIPWKARIDAASGFVVSRPILTFPNVQPGTTHEQTVTVLSSIPAGQTVSIRPLLSALPPDIAIACPVRRLALGPKAKRQVKFTLTAGEGAKPGAVSLTYQFRGQYNSASLTVRGDIVPKPVALPVIPEEAPTEVSAATPLRLASPALLIEPEILDFGEVTAGDAGTSELTVWAERAQTVRMWSAQHPEIGLTLVPAEAELQFGGLDQQVVRVTCLAAEDAPEGEWWSEAGFASGQQTAVVPAVVRIRPRPEPTQPEVSVAPPGLGVPPKAPGAPTASSSGKVHLPQWLRNLLWALLVLLALTLVIYSLKWIFTIAVPEMTKFYLASGIVHVVLALLATVYYLETKIVELEPEELHVRLVEPGPESDPQRTVQDSHPVESLDREPIEVQKKETETQPSHEQAQDTTEEKTTSTSSPALAAQEVNVQKQGAEFQHQLADASVNAKKRFSRSGATISTPHLSVALRKMPKLEDELPEAEDTEVERPPDETEHDRLKAEASREDKEAEDVSPEKRDQEQPIELAFAQTEEQPKELRSFEEVETEVQRPDERMKAKDQLEEPKSRDMAPDRTRSEVARPKVAADTKTSKLSARPIQLAKAQTSFVSPIVSPDQASQPSVAQRQPSERPDVRATEVTQKSAAREQPDESVASMVSQQISAREVGTVARSRVASSLSPLKAPAQSVELSAATPQAGVALVGPSQTSSAAPSQDSASSSVVDASTPQLTARTAGPVTDTVPGSASPAGGSAPGSPAAGAARSLSSGRGPTLSAAQVVSLPGVSSPSVSQATMATTAGSPGAGAGAKPVAEPSQVAVAGFGLPQATERPASSGDPSPAPAMISMPGTSAGSGAAGQPGKSVATPMAGPSTAAGSAGIAARNGPEGPSPGTPLAGSHARGPKGQTQEGPGAAVVAVAPTGVRSPVAAVPAPDPGATSEPGGSTAGSGAGAPVSPSHGKTLSDSPSVSTGPAGAALASMPGAGGPPDAVAVGVAGPRETPAGELGKATHARSEVTIMAGAGPAAHAAGGGGPRIGESSVSLAGAGGLAATPSRTRPVGSSQPVRPGTATASASVPDVGSAVGVRLAGTGTAGLTPRQSVSGPPELPVGRLASLAPGKTTGGVTGEPTLDPPTSGITIGSYGTPDGIKSKASPSFLAGKGHGRSPSVLGPTRETIQPALLPASSLGQGKGGGRSPETDIQIAAALAGPPGDDGTAPDRTPTTGEGTDRAGAASELPELQLDGQRGPLVGGSAARTRAPGIAAAPAAAPGSVSQSARSLLSSGPSVLLSTPAGSSRKTSAALPGTVAIPSLPVRPKMGGIPRGTSDGDGIPPTDQFGAGFPVGPSASTARRTRMLTSARPAQTPSPARIAPDAALSVGAPGIQNVAAAPDGSSRRAEAAGLVAISSLPSSPEQRHRGGQSRPVGETLTAVRADPSAATPARPERPKHVASRKMELTPTTVGLASRTESLVTSVPSPFTPALTERDPDYRPGAGETMTQFTSYLGLFKGSNKAFDERQIRSMRFFADEADRRIDFILSSGTKVLHIRNRAQLLKAPWVFITGEFPFEFTEREARNLREYIELGGWLWLEDCTTQTDLSFDRSFHQQMQLILPDAEFKALPMDHPIFKSCYDFTKGYLGYEIPPGDKYRENRLHAYFVDERPAVIYTRNDYGCGMEIDTKTFASTRRSLTDLTAAEMQNGSVMMSMNLVFYFLGEYGARGLTTRVAEAARRESLRKFEHRVRYHRLFVKGAQDPPFEDFESETAEEWLPIGEGQITESTWSDVDVATARLTPGANRKFEMSFPMRKGKTAFERLFEEPIDLSAHHGLLVDINNRSSALVRVAIAFVTMPGWQYYETAPAFIKPGLNKDVVFYLFGDEFKSAETEWEYQSSLKGADAVKKIIFLNYAIKPGRLTFDNLRFSRVQAGEVRKLLLEAKNSRIPREAVKNETKP